MRILIPLLLLVAACATAPRAGQPLAGRYELVSVNGRSLPAPSAEEPEVVLERGMLVLGEDGRYEMAIAARTRSQADARMPVVRGTYEVDRNALTLRPDEGSGAGTVHFWFTREGQQLRLLDRDDHAYVWRWR
ncbi:MAG TPA: hypothetical protein VFQ45_01555 [Longimicrobium sp.]|nr:hypothetical protein [Longimicrobium sp.]